MRTIKFRGKDVITGNWAYGYYYPSKGNHIIRDEKNNECIVFEKSVSEFTGLKDKNGKEAYESDVVNYAVKKTLCPKCSAKDITNYMEFISIGNYCPTCGTKSSYEDFITTAKVVFDKGGYAYYHENDNDTYQSWATHVAEFYIEWVEIIGNIYENPELIKKQ